MDHPDIRLHIGRMGHWIRISLARRCRCSRWIGGKDRRGGCHPMREIITTQVVMRSLRRGDSGRRGRRVRRLRRRRIGTMCLMIFWRRVGVVIGVGVGGGGRAIRYGCSIMLLIHSVKCEDPSCYHTLRTPPFELATRRRRPLLQDQRSCDPRCPHDIGPHILHASPHQ